jgi:hypothetical protein
MLTRVEGGAGSVDDNQFVFFSPGLGGTWRDVALKDAVRIHEVWV